MGSFKYRASLFLAVFLGFISVAQPGWSGMNFRAPVMPQIPAMPQIPTLPIGNGQEAALQWPSNQINISQLEQILSQNPGLNQLNIQFPNQFNWQTSPGSIQNLLSSIQEEAQNIGVNGSISDLALSSLSGEGLEADQLSIPNLLQGGDITHQLDAVMRQMRYQALNLSNYLPDWLKQVIVEVYDDVYGVFDYVQAQIVSVLLPLFS